MLLLIFSTLHLHADVEKGKAVYAANCAICHTVNGGRALGPDFNLVSYTRTKEEIAHYAKDPYALYEKFGYSANAMPTLPLEDDELLLLEELPLEELLLPDEELEEEELLI